VDESQLRRLRTALVVLGVLACGACRGHRSDGGGGGGAAARGPLERSIAAGVRAQLGVEVGDVRCAGGACTASVVGGGALAISVRGADWELTGPVIAAAPLEQYLAATLGDLGIAATPDCGARVRTAAVGDRVECRLGAAGRAWATIRDGGDFAIELALGADAVAARSGDMDGAALERASAALDRSRRAASDGDGGEDAGAGGGAAAGAP
jgi:hypothetical protein